MGCNDPTFKSNQLTKRAAILKPHHPERQSRALLRGADPRSISALLAATAGCRRRPSPAWLSALQEEMAVASQRARLAAVADGMAVAAAAQTAAAAARGRGLAAAAAAGSSRDRATAASTAGSCPSIDTWAELLLTLAKMGAPLERRCAAALLRDTTAQLPAAAADSACRLLRGMVKARVTPTDGWLQAARESLESLMAVTKSSGEVDQGRPQVTKDNHMTAPQLAGAIRSIALLIESVVDEDEKLELQVTAGRLGRRLAAAPAGAAPGDLALALWALARLGHRAGGGSSGGSSGGGMGEAAAALVPVIEGQLPRLTPSQLSRCMRGLREGVSNTTHTHAGTSARTHMHTHTLTPTQTIKHKWTAFSGPSANPAPRSPPPPPCSFWRKLPRSCPA
jgi:hypothetical protein